MVDEVRILRVFSAGQIWEYITPCTIAALLFVGDLLIPRGATPAIGYCVIPVLAGGKQRPRFLLSITIACTILTWLGYFLEPAGAPAWMSGFDRGMVTGALWLIFRLVWRRNQAIVALARQTQILEETKRELERSNSELDTFASRVAHDIRGPLNTIGLFAHLLGDSQSSQWSIDSAGWAACIENEVNSLGSLTKSLLTYGRVGGGNLQVAPCDCEAVLNSVRQKLRSLIEETGAQVRNDPLPTLAADPTLTAELFQNLIENAIKYRSTEPPRIHVSATGSSEAWRFSVRDNGIGIQPSDLERSFEPFCQLAASILIGEWVSVWPPANALSSDTLVASK
jgi:signal transduction histidine kinase